MNVQTRSAAALFVFVFATVSSLMAQTVEVENLDGLPYPDRLVFSRIGSLTDPPTNGVHERVTLRIRNTGGDALTVTALNRGGANPGRWIVESAPTLPALIAPASFIDVVVRYKAECCKGVHSATLAIVSNDPVTPSKVVELYGYWQPISEGNKEPSLEQLMEIFGYQTVMSGPGQVLSNKGIIEAVGDEVLSPYWRRADGSSPVRLRQLAAWHTYPQSDQILWHYAGSTTTTAITRNHEEDAQSVLPRKKNGLGPAEGQFNPSSSISGGKFGFKVTNEWSDPSMNNRTNDDCSSGINTCGHHMRFFAAKDRQGDPIADSYILIMDHAGVNFDYNDNVYLISNISPEGGFAAPTEIAWSTVAAQPFNNAEGQAVVVGGKLYSFGGFDSQKSCCTPTKRSYVYDPDANSWAPIADLPHTNGGGATHHGVTTDGTDVFIAAGYISNASGTGQIFGTNEVWKYNVGTDTYTSLPNLPAPRAGGRLEYLNGKLHYFGGTNKARTLDVGTHFVLDLANLPGGWVKKKALPKGRHHMSSAVVGGKIYAIGGQKGHDENLVTQSSVHVYDAATNTWKELQPMPIAKGHTAALVYNNQIVILGGEKGHNQALNSVDVYDPTRDSWVGWTNLPVARKSGIAGNLNGHFYFSGGTNTATTYKGVPQETTPAVASQSPAADETEESMLAATQAEYDSSIPDRYALLGSYPNPFNPETTIRYAIPEDVHVRLEVYDVTGRRVAVLVDEVQRPAIHEIRFDGRDLASGMYIYRLQAGAFGQSGRMVFMK